MECRRGSAGGGIEVALNLLVNLAVKRITMLQVIIIGSTLV